MRPSPIRIRSFAKVNLALAVLGKRADGYHEIRTVFQSITLHDELEIQPSPRLELCCRNLAAVPTEENTVWRAATALARAGSPASGARICLKKQIPPGSGLGGGSSNAAAALLGLCRFWHLEVPPAELHALAATIGSDVPFFLQGGTALGIGRGEEIYPLPELRPAHLVVVYPGIQISTAAAYQSLSLLLTSRQNANKIQDFCGRLKDGSGCPAEIFNDFETSILPAYPAVKEAKHFLNQRGATATLLSGSGSSVFGFFSDEESALAASRSSDARESWRVFPTKTLSRAEFFQSMFG
ncbi:MAG: 4-(cytidine 5'-diphospho)-2-C-methyl-D-erythritol kinase [Acidobacteriia bacterium]|nr:4-(cytidine 5'-diphospho)-2-C-methyl-D-erythritol kinase [Terriglobia bacterium]